MAVLQENWRNLIVPNNMDVSFEAGNEKKAVIVLEPLERGYGITLGNALRRVLLSSLRGFAITSIKIDGVLHEYSTIDGIREDVTDIIMNLKSLIINKSTTSPAVLKLKLNKKGQVRAKDIVLTGGVEILNPDLVICNIEDSKVNLNFEMTVEYGMGYCPAENREEDEKETSLIYVDAMFSPIERVSYRVENSRIGQQTDYDKLIMEVETNGTIQPDEAIGVAAKILQTQLDVFVRFDLTSSSDFSGVGILEDQDLNSILARKIDEMELSVRSYNCLINEGIRTLGDLVRKDEMDLLKLPNFGRKSLNELKDNLKNLGLSFGMTLPTAEKIS